MNICWFCLFLRNKSVCHFNWIDFNWSFIWDIWFRSKCFNSCLWWLSILRKSYIMNFWLVISGRLWAYEWVFSILSKVCIFKSCVSFRIFNSITNRIFISRVSSKIDKVPEWIDFHWSRSIPIYSNWFSFKSYFHIFFTSSWEKFKKNRITVFGYYLISRI